MTKMLDKFSGLLLDMNSTFMFEEDRFGPNEDVHATYRAFGGTLLGPGEVRHAIRRCYEGMLQFYRSPEHFDDFPSLAEGLSRFSSAPETELPLLEKVFAAHERGVIPADYAALLCRLSQTHQLGLVTNIWARKEPWVFEFERAGISRVFTCQVFSSDTRSMKPSPVLFQRAMMAFPAGSCLLFVGDSLEYDIKPAKALGLATAWINARGESSPHADYVLPNLLALEAPTHGVPAMVHRFGGVDCSPSSAC